MYDQILIFHSLLFSFSSQMFPFEWPPQTTQTLTCFTTKSQRPVAGAVLQGLPGDVQAQVIAHNGYLVADVDEWTVSLDDEAHLSTLPAPSVVALVDRLTDASDLAAAEVLEAVESCLRGLLLRSRLLVSFLDHEPIASMESIVSRLGMVE